MSNKKIFVSILTIFDLVICTAIACAQAPGDLANNTANEALRPQSPNVSALTAYAQIPVNKYTGIPSISFPIYTIKSGDLELPISLSYHCAGFKPSMEASWVGLGWALNAGGVISRSVRGGDDLPDFNTSTSYLLAPPLPTIYNNEWAVIKENGPITPTPEVYNYQNIISNQIDLQPDQYYFNFGGFSGKFYVKKRQNSADLVGKVTATVADQSSLKVELIYSDRSWIITDGKGIKYYFKTQERSSTYTATRNSKLNVEYDFEDDSMVPCEDLSTINAWYLDKIKSPMGDSILFDYDVPQGCQGIKSQPSLSHQHFEPSDLASGSVYDPNGDDYYTYSRTLNQEVVLSGIRFKNGNISFEKNPRSDLDGYQEYQPSLLNSITVLAGSEIVKKVTFKYDYFNPEGDVKYRRLKLNSFTAQDEKYSFKYNESVSLPAKTTFGIDHWGYYNGADDGSTPISKYEVGTQSVIYGSGTNRESNFEYAKAGLLKEISYPTGTIAKLEYESNTASNGVQTLTYRVISGSAESGNPYNEFGLPGFKSFEFNVLPAYSYSGSDPSLFNTNIHASAVGSRRFYEYSTSATGYSPLPEEEDTYGLLISIDSTMKDQINYSSVMEYIENSGSSDCGYEILQYFDYNGLEEDKNNTQLSNNYPGYSKNVSMQLQPGWYRVISQAHPYFSATVVINHKTPSGVVEGVNQYPAAGLRIKSIKNEDNGLTSSYRRYEYSNGVLMAKPSYKKHESLRKKQWNYLDETGVWTSQETFAYYNVFNSSSYNPMQPSAQGNFVGYGTVKEAFDENGFNGKVITNYYNLINPIDNSMPGIPVNENILNGKVLTECILNASGDTLRKTSNNYGLDISKRERIQGVAYYTYPFFNIGEDLNYAYFFKIYDILSDWSKLQSTTTTDYRPEGNIVTKTHFIYNPLNRQVAQSIREVNDSEKLITKYKYATDYNASTGSVLSGMKLANMIDMPIETQTWRQKGSEQSLIKSNITEYKAFANNSFFAPHKTYSLKTTSPLTSTITGESLNSTAFNTVAFNDDYFFNEFFFDIDKIFDYNDQGRLVQISNSTGLKTSYLWGYSNLYPIAEISNVPYSNIQGILDPQIIQYPQNDAVLRLELNKLRQSFPQSMITTYTYNPLVGISSKTDAKGICTFFEYDQYQRLKNIKDHEGNLLKSFNYHYRNSQLSD